MPAMCMCPNINCRKILTVPDDTRGKIVRCVHCQNAFRVPSAKPVATTAQKKSA